MAAIRHIALRGVRLQDKRVQPRGIAQVVIPVTNKWRTKF